ncbi:MAG: hypothetical protein AYK18_04240 [Theionarchaea archaeon DG-70]|nr:MAG: hypothetical protein AYK18_04240 [Theionarchaea archaeon DG-70]
MDKKASSPERIAISILLVLIGVNAAWAVTSRYTGPVIGVVFYGIIGFLCWQKSHFQAGIIGGIIGLVIHVLELLSVGEINGAELGFFLVNLVLPIPLIYFSYQASGK